MRGLYAILETILLRRLIIAIAAASALGISFCPNDASARRNRAAVADGVPSWDQTASCRAAASIAFGQTPSERLTSCLATEQRTREELNKNWSTFPAADRIGCVKSLCATWRPPLYFDLARINLDSTTPAMMAPAITRIVVRSMFIDYPSSR